MRVDIDLYSRNSRTKYAVISTYKGTSNIRISDDLDDIKHQTDYNVIRLSKMTFVDGVLDLRGDIMLTADTWGWINTGTFNLDRKFYTPEDLAEKYDADADEIRELNAMKTIKVMKSRWWGLRSDVETGETLERFRWDRAFTGNTRTRTEVFSNYRIIDEDEIISWGKVIL